MTTAAAVKPSREELLDEVVTAYLKVLEGGQVPDNDDFLRRYPELASELSQFFAAQEELDRLTISFRRFATQTNGESTELGVLGDFHLIREIGRGGMGIVLEAEQISLHRRVALKILPFASTLDARQLQRFKNEAHAAAHLHHQNIVPVYATGCERGVHYYAMQYIEGQTLADLIADLREQRELNRGGAEDTEKKHLTDSSQRPLRLCGEISLQQVAELGIQAAEALEHELGGDIGLTPSQRRELSEIQRGWNERLCFEYGELLRKKPMKERESFVSFAFSRRGEPEALMLEVLTPKQREEWTRRLGEPLAEATIAELLLARNKQANPSSQSHSRPRSSSP